MHPVNPPQTKRAWRCLWRRWRRAFTLIEMLVVISIIALLAAMLLPVLSMARAAARKANCKSNLKQFESAIAMYRSNFQDAYPPWLSSLFPGYQASDAVYICPSDHTLGQEGGMPEWFSDFGANQFTETDDNGKGTARADILALRNDKITGCSYMYEFGWAECSWWTKGTWADFDNDGFVSWWEAKETEMKGMDFQGGKIVTDNEEAYGGHVPMIRCFWHADKDDNLFDEPVLNLACEHGNIYECMVEGGDWKRASK